MILWVARPRLSLEKGLSKLIYLLFSIQRGNFQGYTRGFHTRENRKKSKTFPNSREIMERCSRERGRRVR